MKRSILLLELNEVPLRVFDHFLKSHPNGALSRVWKEIDSYELLAADKGHLSPWVTWPSLHRGVNDETHGIRYFGQSLRDVNLEFPPIWEILAAKGISTGVFGSLQSYPIPDNAAENYRFYVPDTFAAGSECIPPEISTFQKLNLEMVDASARNVSRSIPISNAVNFMLQARKLGIRASTLMAAVLQVTSEFLAASRKGRRRTFQAVLAFDIFVKYLREKKPEFASFFTNHVASSLHRYWAATFPGDFSKLEYSNDWIKEYSGEINFAMEYAEKFILELIEFCRQNTEYVLIIASSMGQAAADGSMVNSQVCLTDPEQFMKTLGISKNQWTKHRAMVPQFACEVGKDCRESFRKQLESMKICGEKLDFSEKENGYFCLQFGRINMSDSDCTAEVSGHPITFTDIGLKNLLIEDQAGSTGYHVRSGSLLIYDPKLRSGKRQSNAVSALDIAPTILRELGVAIPPYMRGEPIPLRNAI